MTMDMRQIKLAILGILSLLVVYKLLTPLVYAIVVAYIAYPLFVRLDRILKHESLAAGITTIVSFGIIVYPAIKIAESFIFNAEKIGQNIVQGFTTFGAFIGITEISAGSALSDAITQKILYSFGMMLLNVPLLILELFIFVILVFYFLRDGEKLKDYFYHLIAKEEKFQDIFKEVERLLGSVIIGSFTAAVMIGLIAGLMMKALGVPFVLTIALITAISAMLPVIGTWFVYVPLVGYYLIIVKNYPMAAIMIGFAFLLQFLEMYLGPFLSGKKSKIHPGLMILGFIGGPLFFGIKGLVLGPVILGALKISLDHYKKE